MWLSEQMAKFSRISYATKIRIKWTRGRLERVQLQNRWSWLLPWKVKIISVYEYLSSWWRRLLWNLKFVQSCIICICGSMVEAFALAPVLLQIDFNVWLRYCWSALGITYWYILLCFAHFKHRLHSKTKLWPVVSWNSLIELHGSSSRDVGILREPSGI